MKWIDLTTQITIESPLNGWDTGTGGLLNLEHEALFDLPAIVKREPNLWRYKEAIPLANHNHIVSVKEGFTPLLFIDFNGKKVGIKQEQLFSTGSYKDRGATVLMSVAKEMGIQQVVQDSSGNAGCSIAAYAAMAGIKCTIYLQTDTSPSKIAQIQSYGADIVFIDGTREDVAEATLQAAQKTYYASHCRNPLFFHGTKTFAYEVCEQLNWKAPDSVVLPVGNGTLVIGCYIGFMDLLKAGVISKMPKIIAIQSTQCAPLAHAFDSNQNNYSVINSFPTLAEGIAIAQPVRGNQILQIVRESKGFFISVEEAEIISAWQTCAAKGFYIEPTSAATIAGVLKYVQGSTDETIVSLFSGHGLKSTDKIQGMISGKK